MTDEVARAYDDVRGAVSSAVLPGSPLARPVREWLTDHPLPPSLLLPIAAAGGTTPPAVALSASMAFLLLVMRWLDDLVDRDREGQLWQTYGEGGAAVPSAAALTHSWACLAREPTVPRDVLAGFGEMTAVLAAMAKHDVRARCESQAAAYAGQARQALDRCPGPWTNSCAGLLPALSS